MHVRGCARDLAEGGRLEVALARAGVGEFAVAPGDAGIVEAFVRKIGADVASRAVCFASEQLQAGLFFRREGGAVATDEAVEPRITREDRPKEAGERPRNLFRREAQS